jgi:hypothetical protein
METIFGIQGVMLSRWFSTSPGHESALDAMERLLDLLQQRHRYLEVVISTALFGNFHAVVDPHRLGVVQQIQRLLAVAVVNKNSGLLIGSASCAVDVHRY